MTTKTKRPARKSDRRQFLRSLALVGGVVSTSLLGFVPVVMGWVNRLRPPGALSEQKFLSACIKCGQCVQVCPVKAIKLADITDGNGMGTPILTVASRPAIFPVMVCSAYWLVLQVHLPTR